MPQYEYRVIPAPDRGLKARGFSTADSRFANALQTLMNDMGMRGWEYQRAETLPVSDGDGPESAGTQWRNMLVFRRQIPERSPLILQATERLDVKYPPAPVADAPQKRAEPPRPMPYSQPAGPDDDASQSEGATRMLRDNGVEEHSDVSGISNALMRLAASRNHFKSGN
ncbi:DUF4177 domain-containing protein [Roseobacter ponti]|uniref:DUF4177 domain-containing protein n=1 Tax=Roseobacter ponti TaxID=1891787 RepID=A0A858STA3_9RHOB|nr:DUF4177 domain-containing protein [Roseobacter ponti]QJF50801.1 DUF4177 domain-containing protein [Roseobacter ponti]